MKQLNNQQSNKVHNRHQRQIQQPILARHNALTYSFLENKLRLSFLEYMINEYLYVFYLFYTQQIESGQKAIRDFYHMSMCDVNQELKLRAILLRKTKEQIKQRRKRKKQEEEKQKEQRQRNLLEQLKNDVQITHPRHKYDR